MIGADWLRSRLPTDYEVDVLINRVDVRRTYAEAPVLLRARGQGTLLATTRSAPSAAWARSPRHPRSPANGALLQWLLESI